MILEKRGGRVAYAVLSFGGFWGIGDDYYPLPWEKLSYDENLDGYRIDMTKEQVEGAFHAITSCTARRRPCSTVNRGVQPKTRLVCPMSTCSDPISRSI